MGSTTAVVLITAVVVFVATALVVSAGESGHQDDDHGDDHHSTMGFTITSSIYATYAASGCSGSTPALLFPGTTRCAVFSVHNNLNVPVTVTSITTALSDVGLPALCVGVNLTIPVFSGSLAVPAGGDANTLGVQGVPISLNESHSNQNACQDLTYHFRYQGTAQYTAKSMTVLSSDPNRRPSGTRPPSRPGSPTPARVATPPPRRAP